MTSPAEIRANFSVPFPPLVRGQRSPDGGVSIVKQNGVWTVILSPANFPVQIHDVTKFPTDYLLGYDTIANANFISPLNDLANPAALLAMHARGVNLNAVGDTVLPIILPQGISRYNVASWRAANPSRTLSTAVIQAWTGAGGTGVQVGGTTTMSITSTAPDVAGNSMQLAAIVNPNLVSIIETTLYIRVTTPEGVPATVDVTFQIILM